MGGRGGGGERGRMPGGTGSGRFRGPLLALSESSGSPASSPRTPEKMDAEEGGGEGWSGLLTSTPQHSPQGKREGEGLDDVASEGEDVMSPASEQSLLSVPELQETMEKLSMLASEGRESEAGETDDGESPNSLASPPSSSGPQNPEERAGTREGEGPGKAEPPSLLLEAVRLDPEGNDLAKAEAMAAASALA
ncbi:hypothetical protein ANANG_G00181470 [Anguilla anguilla]|uniref:Uncharacterized protein n=1 Tax=Anguilla anguilla TaxID=7936 RepID=A0A9D3RTV8_ANGAN|nr:hypothetical protein ANANG_G00181470 [Anguilla anguilla]